MNDWLTHYALQAQRSDSAKVFVISDAERVTGYCALSVGAVDTLEVPARVRAGMGRYPIPVILIARLAVDLREQGRGLGAKLLKEAIRRGLRIAELAGVRALLTHPIDEEAVRFYLRFGFETSPLRDGQFLLLLKDARKYVV